MELRLNDRQDLQLLRLQVERSLEPVALENDLSVRAGRITFDRDGGNCVMKLEFAKVNDDGVAETPERKAYLEAASLKYNDLKPEWLEQYYRLDDGRILRVTGYNYKAKKYPVEYAINGKRYKAPVDYVVALIGNATKVK